MPYKPNEEGKRFDRRTGLHKYACDNKGRDCPDFKDDGDEILRECLLSHRCNWGEQGYTPISRYPRSLSCSEVACFGVKIKKDEI